MRKLMITALLMGVAGTVFAEEMRMPINANDLQWGLAPNAFPAGAQIAVISGDPFNEGLYVVRLKMPADYKIPAHYHPTSEYITVLSGDFHVGMGDKLDPQKGQLLRSGGFAEAPANMNHYAWSTRKLLP
jgi:quercetin dioxygenase-like cupin family protein